MKADPASFMLYIFVAGFLATFTWRALGVVFAERLNADSEVLVWVKLVATALMAALVMRLIVLPPGALETSALTSRIAGMMAGVAIYWLGPRKLLPPVIGAALVFLGIEALRTGNFF